MRAVVADDHPVFRRGLRVLLEDLGVEVVAEAADGDEAVAAALRERPDVVLLDVQMPGATGIEATRRLLAAWPEARVLLVTMVDDDEAVFAAVQAGALGYVLKGAGQAELGRALQAVAAGEAVYGAGVARRLRAFFTAGSGVVAKPFPELSEREREVLACIADGLPNAAVARRLHLSEKTVRNYVTSVFSKLGVTDRTAAALRAREAGLGSSGR